MSYCESLLRAFICSSTEQKCVENYFHNTKVYECLLKNEKITIQQYRNQYNPSREIGDKIYQHKLEIDSKEYYDDKERRIQNFQLFGKFEPNEHN
jgi:hypothetical protein